MTPKEKAEELISKFEKIEDSLSPYGNSLLFDKEAIQCALITVNEIIEYSTNKCCEFQNVKYWKEVKNEINKL